MAQARPAEHVPLIAAGEEMLDQRFDRRRVIVWPTDHATDLGQARIGAEELQHPHHRRPDAGNRGAHQRRDGHEAPSLVPHDMAEELVVEQHVSTTGKPSPPWSYPCWRCEWTARRNLTVEHLPLGGDLAKRLGPAQPLDCESPYRKSVVQG